MPISYGFMEKAFGPTRPAGEKKGTGDSHGSCILTLNLFAAGDSASGLIGIRQFCRKR